MGSFTSSPSPSTTSQSSDEVNQENIGTSLSSNRRKSKRFMDELFRQSSKSDISVQTSYAIDPNKFKGAQNPDGGENQNRDHHFTTADLGE